MKNGVGIVVLPGLPYCSCESLEEEIGSFGLSRRTQETPVSIVCGRGASVACPVR